MRARLLAPRATGMPDLDAQADFRWARRAYGAARAWRWVTGQRGPSRPATFPEAAPALGGRPQLTIVPLNQIIGTVDPTSHFDASFRPASELVRQRWERVALAHRRGVALPPIELVQGPDGFYIVDGRHRVSVARIHGIADIDAWVHRPSLVHKPLTNLRDSPSEPREGDRNHADAGLTCGSRTIALIPAPPA